MCDNTHSYARNDASNTVDTIPWTEWLDAFGAGQSDLRTAIANLLKGHTLNHVLIGQELIRHTEFYESTHGQNIPFILSCLKIYLGSVEIHTISQLDLYESFCNRLASIISSHQLSAQVRATAILIARIITTTNGSHRLSYFAAVTDAIVLEINRISVSLRQLQDSINTTEECDTPPPVPVVRPEEFLLHQISDFLKGQRDTNASWISGFSRSLMDISDIMELSVSLRAQCEVEVMQIHAKLFDIGCSAYCLSQTTSQQLLNQLSEEQWVSLTSKIISQVTRSKVIHDAFQYALMSAFDYGNATSLVSFSGLTSLVDQCYSIINTQPLTGLFMVKIIESIVGMIGVLFEKGSALLAGLSDVNSGGVSSVGTSALTSLSSLQSRLMVFMEFTKRQQNSQSSSLSSSCSLSDARNACQDTRNGCISTAIIIIKTAPSTVQNNPSLFWDLCTNKLRTPLLFSHYFEVSSDRSMTTKIIQYISAALQMVNKYWSGDACKLVISISDISKTSAFYDYHLSSDASGMKNTLAADLLYAFTVGPKVSVNAGPPTDLTEWKSLCVGALDNLIKVHVKLLEGTPIVDTIVPLATSCLFFSADFCNAFLRAVVSEYFVLHQACGLKGGPRGSSTASKSRGAMQKEAIKSLGRSDNDAIEPILIQVTSCISNFLEGCLNYVNLSKTAAVSMWFVDLIASWRDYKDVDSISVCFIFMKYVAKSLSRAVLFDSDLDQICADIDVLSKLVLIQLAWIACIQSSNGETELFRENSEISSPGSLHIKSSNIKEVIGSICQCVIDISASSASTISPEAKDIVSQIAKDCLVAIEQDIFSRKCNSQQLLLGVVPPVLHERHAAILDILGAVATDIDGASSAVYIRPDNSKFRILLVDLFEKLLIA